MLFFYIPSLTLHMKKVTINRNNLLCCIYRTKTSDTTESDIPIESTPSKEPNITNPSYSKLDPGSTITNPNQSQLTAQQDDSKESIFKNIFFNWSFYKFSLLYDTNFKYVILALFSCYFIANAFICSFRVNIDIPLSEILPSESYLSKHMTNHIRDFDLGPMIMLNFMKPINMSDISKWNKINQFIGDAKQIDGM